MYSEIGGVSLAGCTTREEGDSSPLCVGPRDGSAVEVTADEAVIALTAGVDTASQMVGLVGTAVTAV